MCKEVAQITRRRGKVSQHSDSGDGQLVLPIMLDLCPISGSISDAFSTELRGHPHLVRNLMRSDVSLWLSPRRAMTEVGYDRPLQGWVNKGYRLLRSHN